MPGDQSDSMPMVLPLFSLSYPVLNYLTTIKLFIRAAMASLAETLSPERARFIPGGKNGSFASWRDGA
jgi:hypothetical protein